MQLIGFNEHYGLQTAVFEKWKPMTRRLEKGLENLEEGNFSFNKNKGEIKLYGEKGSVIEVIKSRYKIGEVVAVKQSYKEIWDTQKRDFRLKIGMESEANEGFIFRKFLVNGGWDNKMFVKAEFMPHRIKITDIDVERLQEISDEDCLKEGIFYDYGEDTDGSEISYFDFVGNNGNGFDTPREAFAALIDKVSGKGTWNSNPWVFAYSFELIK